LLSYNTGNGESYNYFIIAPISYVCLLCLFLDYTTYNDVCIMFCDVVNFTQHGDMDEALHELSVAHTWLVRLCQVFRLELVSLT